MSTEPNKIIYSMVGVSKYYDKKAVLKDIYLSYFYGAKIGVIGLNGSGKSSLLRIMAGVDKEINGEAVLSPGYTVGFLEQEPLIDDKLNRGRFIGDNRLNRGVQWLCVGPPFDIDRSTLHSDADILGRKRDRAIQYGSSICVPPQHCVGKGNLLQSEKVLRIQLHCAFHVVRCFIPASLPAVDVPRQQKWKRIVRQGSPRSGQFAAGAIIIAIPPIKMFRQRKVSFTGVGT